MKVYLVIHELHTYGRYMNKSCYSEEVETVNSQVIGAYFSYNKAKAEARRFFFNERGLTHSDDSDLDAMFCYGGDENISTFMESVDVVEQNVE